MQKLCLVLVMLLCALGMQASTLDTLNYLGYPYGLHDGSYYVGNAKGSLASDPDDQFEMWCIDSLHRMENHYQVYVMTLVEATTNGYMGFSLADYQTMAVLGNGFTNYNPNDSQVQHAIWSLGDNRSLTPIEQAILTQAQASIGNRDYSNIRAFIPAQPGVGQAMMDGETSLVPEPTTLVLSGAGLLLVLGGARRRPNNRN